MHLWGYEGPSASLGTDFPSCHFWFGLSVTEETSLVGLIFISGPRSVLYFWQFVTLELYIALVFRRSLSNWPNDWSTQTPQGFIHAVLRPRFFPVFVNFKLVMIGVCISFLQKLLSGDIFQQICHNFWVELRWGIELKKLLTLLIKDDHEYVKPAHDAQLYGFLEETPLSLRVSGDSLLVVLNVLDTIYLLDFLCHFNNFIC